MEFFPDVFDVCTIGRMRSVVILLLSTSLSVVHDLMSSRLMRSARWVFVVHSSLGKRSTSQFIVVHDLLSPRLIVVHEPLSFRPGRSVRLVFVVMHSSFG